MTDLLQHKMKSLVSDANIEAQSLPGAEDIRLWLLSEDFPKGRLPDDEMRAVLESPPYWSFCWASGVAMASWILNNGDIVEGKRVVDFGCGSGVMAIAAKKAGASEVVALDIDQDALDASAANAELNAVDIIVSDDIESLNYPFDVLLATDVLYDRDNYGLLAAFPRWASDIYVADSRVKEFPNENYQLIDQLEARTHPDLGEPDEFGQVKLYRSRCERGEPSSSKY